MAAVSLNSIRTAGMPCTGPLVPVLQVTHPPRPFVPRVTRNNVTFRKGFFTRRNQRTASGVFAFKVLRGGEQTEHMSNTVTQFFQEVYNAGNTQYITDITTEDVVYSDRCWMEADLVGQKKLLKFLDAWQRGYPDLRVHLDTVLVREDCNVVMAHTTCFASNLGEFRGDPASGRVSVFSGVTMFTFADGKIKEIVCYRQPTEEERAVFFGWEHY